MSIKEKNTFQIALDGETIIGRSQSTIDGRYIAKNEVGTYLTTIGEVTVDLRRRLIHGDKYYSGPVVVSGEGLKRSPRPNTKDLLRHRSATSGTHAIEVGYVFRGTQHIGKNPQTGKIRTLEVE